MANKDTKRCSLFLIIRKMQIKITMRYLPVRKINIKKSTNNKFWRECREKRTLVHCWWEHKLVHPLWGILGKCLKKLKIHSYHAILQSYSWTYIQRKILIQKDTFTSVFITALFTTAKTWKQPKHP